MQCEMMHEGDATRRVSGEHGWPGWRTAGRPAGDLDSLGHTRGSHSHGV